uniref:Uncharacterized protein n=1 Tax=Rhizophora mucronata TaxID=61149 RepID=A0A2P2N6M9_RHIMU
MRNLHSFNLFTRFKILQSVRGIGCHSCLNRAFACELFFLIYSFSGPISVLTQS